MSNDNGFDFMLGFFSSAAYGMKLSKEMTIDEAIEIMTVGSDKSKEVEELCSSKDFEKSGMGLVQKIIAQGIVVSYAKNKRVEEKKVKP